ncbi:MAG TPA: polysaccharide deacetylase family protein, partial [Opitutaceae bacterium]
MPPPTATPSWLRQLGARYGSHAVLKALATPLVITGFFAAYFHLLRHPLFPVTTIPATPLDVLIPFWPAALAPYFSLWGYIVVGSGTLRGRREIGYYCAGLLILLVGGLGTFLLWPTQTPPPDIDWSRHPSFQFLQGVDSAGNAWPSLHVAFAVFTAIWLERLLRDLAAPRALRATNALWALAIVYSTLATRQHVLADVLAGLALGGAAGLLDPRPRGRELCARPSWCDRLVLALAISLSAKAALFLIGLATVPAPLVAALWLLPDGWILLHLLVPNFSGLVPTATRFVTPAREVWLTIDDGPEPATTGPMLDLLDRHGARATFFVIGEKAAAHPALRAQIRARGHTLGNHTHTHPLASFGLAGPWRTARELERCDAELRSATGEAPPTWFRAPAGIKTFFLRRVLARRDR